jgi:holo-[acyl-carrier protein] synthase
MPTRVGIDLVSVESVRDSVRTHDRRYLERVYTERELRDCRDGESFNHERLAARFAAKEATMKVLRPGNVGVPWNSIGVRRDPDGWVALELSGLAAELASASEVSDLAVSMTHEDGRAAAVVVAQVSHADV